jgi:uncharacterized protein DUF2760
MRGRQQWKSVMRVVSIIAVLLLAVLSGAVLGGAALGGAALSGAGLGGAALVSAADRIRQYLPEATLALAILAFIALLAQPSRKAPPPAPAAEPARPAPPPPEANRAEAEIVQFLAMLQEKGRLVDFLMDDINAYPDAQVGAAARVVHAGCKAVLQEHFRIIPVRSEQEGSTVQVPAGYAADEYRLIGKIAGAAPFSGVLVHRGWKTDMVKLPRLLRGAADRFPAIAPAEVEVK